MIVAVKLIGSLNQTGFNKEIYITLWEAQR